MAIQEFDWVDYFPSFEIITGNFSAGRYYEEDLREINSTGVSHAMRCFLASYVAPSKNVVALSADSTVVTTHPHRNSAPQVTSRMRDVVCDEELIERVSF
jgi:hypothetical protein